MKQPNKEKVEQYRKEFSELLKELMAQTIGKMLQAELDEFLGYEKYKRSNNPNYRNGSYEKKPSIPPQVKSKSLYQETDYLSLNHLSSQKAKKSCLKNSKKNYSYYTLKTYLQETSKTSLKTSTAQDFLQALYQG